VSGRLSEEAVRSQWWWCVNARRAFDDVERYLTDDLNHMGETIPFDDEVIETLAYCADDTSKEVEGVPRFATQLSALRDLLVEIQRIARKSVVKEQIIYIRQLVRDLREAHDWLSDWTEEEWMLVHYWSKVDVGERV
jgi:hypothetical protein